MIRKIFLTISVLIFASVFPAISLAETQYEQINPKDGFNYGLKRFKEKVTFILKFSKGLKAGFLAKQVDMRLSELKYTVDQKDMANFESATTRYFATVGQYTAFLKEKNVEYNKDLIVEKLNGHTEVIKGLQKNFDSTTAEWRFLEDDINYVKIYLDSI